MEQQTSLSRVDRPEEDPFASFPPVRTLALSQRAKALILVAMALAGIAYLAVKFLGDEGVRSSPERAMTGFLNAMREEDPDRMFEYAEPDAEMMKSNDLDKTKLIERYREIFAGEHERLRAYEVLSVEMISGEEATARISVEFDYKEDNQKMETDLRLRKLAEEWFVSFPF